ncbi:hypothetical protein FLCU109888_11145 [Flavobacterium cucumis]|uniref:Uncharacterized protein n=1 Tax=Flavobacterium cucumis TaxID=416016 RepID=A0A1M7ZZL9_9FLAO|nr:hypothetical protein [Flavobacterium cucumis]SHO74260.1 hypothetical protein SAMN05443547_2650 [Flavobacterium cucumis]
MKKRYPSSTLLFLFCFLIFFNCKENNFKKKAVEKELIEKKQIKPFLETPPKDDVTYQEDSTKEYEYRTGTAGDYTYVYDIYGFDSEGNEVTGTIVVNGKYGNGLLINVNGAEIEITVAWIGKGELRGKDKEANEYALFVRED